MVQLKLPILRKKRNLVTALVFTLLVYAVWKSRVSLHHPARPTLTHDEAERHVSRVLAANRLGHLSIVTVGSFGLRSPRAQLDRRLAHSKLHPLHGALCRPAAV